MDKDEKVAHYNEITPPPLSPPLGENPINFSHHDSFPGNGRECIGARGVGKRGGVAQGKKRGEGDVVRGFTYFGLVQKDLMIPFEKSPLSLWGYE